MRLVKFFCVGLAILGAAATTFAQEKPDKIADVLRVTGLSKQLTDVPNLMSLFVAQRKSTTDQKIYGIIEKAVADAFGNNVFVDKVGKAIEKNYDESLVDKILQDYDNDNFKKITEHEISTSSGGVENQISNFDYGSVSSDRDKIISDYVRDSNQEEMTAELVEDTLRSFLVILNLSLPEAKKMAPSTIDRVIDKAVDGIHSDETRMNEKKRVAITYAEFSDNQLREYFSYANSNEGKWLRAQLMSGVKEAFDGCMKNAVIEITSAMGQSG